MQNPERIRTNAGPRVFVAMPFGEKRVTHGGTVGTANRTTRSPKEVTVNFDDVWRQLIAPALERAGCRPYRADDEVSAGDIRTDMFFELVTGEFVLADISTLNANVFYELGVRHGVSPRGILMVDGGWDRRPFDVAPDRTFTYEGSLFEVGIDRDVPNWKSTVSLEVEKLAQRLQAAIATDASTTSSPVYKELIGLKPADWGQIQNAKARYFGGQLQEWNTRVRKARRQSHVGDILTLSRDAPNRFIEWQLRLDAARALFDLGRFERARELLRAMVNENPTCPETRYALAKTLDRMAGRTPDPQLKREYHGRAEIEIEDALSRGGNDPEAHRLLGRIYKYRWRHRWEHERDEKSRRRLAAKHWETARKGLCHYQEAQMRDLACFHAGLNVISLSQLHTHLRLPEAAQCKTDLDDLVGLVRTAAHRALLQKEGTVASEKDISETIWANAALGEVALLTAKVEDAMRFYQSAATHPDVSVSQLRTFDEQLQMYESIGFRKNYVVQLRAMVKEQLEIQNRRARNKAAKTQADRDPQVFAFRGEPFHDSELEEEVRSKLTTLTDQWDIREGDVVICSARRGSEIMFAEECVKRQADVRLLLPTTRAEFVNRCVRKTGSDWERRFYRLAEKCEVLEQPVRLGAAPADLDPSERNNVWCLDIARTEFGPEVRPRVIVFSIGGNASDPIDERGGWRHFEQHAQGLDLFVEKIIVRSAADAPTWFPTSKTLVLVRRPNDKTATLPLEMKLRVGRAENNDVILPDPSISRYHLTLQPVAEGVLLTNLSGHKNATIVAGKALTPDPEGERPELVSLEEKIELIDGTEITFE